MSAISDLFQYNESIDAPYPAYPNIRAGEKFVRVCRGWCGSLRIPIPVKSVENLKYDPDQTRVSRITSDWSPAYGLYYLSDNYYPNVSTG